ncbi:UNVERIFIED_CONTAM: protein GRAVITROPIC IN THE LIGHT 1 [Sesamum latifolium]|uniref:Protein GRAVITROPIC IN THE LIGHT 1 n=1 Tax=Sesamum latifolium TaxID=2727402 RepID=A0AAW2XX13_9LAMI
MTSKVSNFSDLIQRVTASCLLHPLAGVARPDDISVADEEEDYQIEAEEEEEEFKINTNWEATMNDADHPPRVMELEMLMGQVFDAVSVMKRAYGEVQTERWRRRWRGGGGGRRWGVGAATLREVVAPYESAVEELKREVKAKHAEIENLREKLKTATSFDRISGKSKGKSKRRVSCTTQVAAAPAMELFEATMSLVNEASKSFTSLLLSLMRSAHWDIAAAVRSIDAASSTSATMNNPTTTNTMFTDSVVGANHAKYALESYLWEILLQEVPLDCAPEDGGIVVWDLEQRRQVLDGHHPRSQFYGEFLGLAKAVWLLHLLAFSLDPPPSHFEASRGAEFHSQYMESVVRISGNNGGPKVGMSMVVGFPVSPGFKLGNGSIIKAKVYLVPKN